MAQEIERRFLLRDFPAIFDDAKVTKIEQGYFEMPALSDSFRVRILGGKSSVLTLKDGRGVSREEDEEPISLGLALKLLNKCHHRLTKLRIAYQGWEIDIFGDVLAGIILAEFEFKRKGKKLKIPEWLKPFIIREVTDSLTNLHLARLASDLKGTELSASVHLDRNLMRIPKHVLTGGPCSGKSTIMELLKKDFPNFHFVPEVATIIIAQLGILPGSDLLSQFRFQRTIYRTQKHFEATSAQYAISQNKSGLFLDRATWDGKVYLPDGAFEHAVGTNQADEYEQYDSVTYLSVPPREIYEANKKNNPARRETYEQAYELGQKIYRAWKDHPSFHEATSENWEEKVKSVRNVLK